MVYVILGQLALVDDKHFWYKYTVAAGGQGGSGGWKHTPDQVEEQYQGSTITVDGQQITSGNLDSYFAQWR